MGLFKTTIMVHEYLFISNVILNYQYHCHYLIPNIMNEMNEYVIMNHKISQDIISTTIVIIIVLSHVIWLVVSTPLTNISQ